MTSAETVREITRILNERRPDYPWGDAPERVLMHMTLGMLEVRGKGEREEAVFTRVILESMLRFTREFIPDQHQTPANIGPNEYNKKV